MIFSDIKSIFCWTHDVNLSLITGKGYYHQFHILMIIELSAKPVLNLAICKLLKVLDPTHLNSINFHNERQFNDMISCWKIRCSKLHSILWFNFGIIIENAIRRFLFAFSTLGLDATRFWNQPRFGSTKIRNCDAQNLNKSGKHV